MLSEEAILSTLLLSAGILAGVAEFLLLLFGMDAASELTVGDFRGAGWCGIVRSGGGGRKKDHCFSTNQDKPRIRCKGGTVLLKEYRKFI